MAANVSSVAFGPGGDVPLIVIIGVAALTVDGTAAAVIGRAPSLKSSAFTKPRRSSSPTTASLVARVA